MTQCALEHGFQIWAKIAYFPPGLYKSKCKKPSVNAMLMLQDQTFKNQEIPEVKFAPTTFSLYVAHLLCFKYSLITKSSMIRLGRIRFKSLHITKCGFHLTQTTPLKKYPSIAGSKLDPQGSRSLKAQGRLWFRQGREGTAGQYCEKDEPPLTRRPPCC